MGWSFSNSLQALDSWPVMHGVVPGQRGMLGCTPCNVWSSPQTRGTPDNHTSNVLIITTIWTSLSLIPGVMSTTLAAPRDITYFLLFFFEWWRSPESSRDLFLSLLCLLLEWCRSLLLLGLLCRDLRGDLCGDLCEDLWGDLCLLSCFEDLCLL